MSPEPSQQQMQEVGNAIVDGKMILAIKLYREATGCGLAEAKTFIEKLAAEMRAAQPGKFAARPIRAVPVQAVWWILWLAITMSCMVIYTVLGKQTGPADPAFSYALWWVALVNVALSTINRWAILPRIRMPARALACFIVGLALSESVTIFATVILPEKRDTLFALSLAGIVQYIPIFASKFTRPA